MTTIVRAAEYSEFKVTRMASALGAIATGLDLGQGVGSQAFAAIQDLMLEHSVLCIRNPGGCSPNSCVTSGANGAKSSITHSHRNWQALPVSSGLADRRRSLLNFIRT